MTSVRAAGAGGRWTSARPTRSWRPRRRGCPAATTGVVVAAVPWARHDSAFTRAFEDQVSWLAVTTSKTAVSELMRIAWRSVGWICERVMLEAQARRDLLCGLARLGFDEISIRRGQRYLTVVVDHDTGRLVWAAPGRDRKTVETFLDLLGKQRCERIELVSCDMADWITRPIAERCPNAEVCLDAFHVVKLATDALDEIRREVWNEARRAGEIALARDLKGARFALWKNPENLTARQQLKLAHIQRINQRLYRAYLLKEQLRQIYRVDPGEGDRRPRRVAEVGVAMSPRAVRQARPHDPRPASRDRGRAAPPTLKRPDRADQHPDPADHPPRLRLPLTLGRHRPGHAVTRRPVPTPPRPLTQPTVPAGDSQKGSRKSDGPTAAGIPHRDLGSAAPRP